MSSSSIKKGEIEKFSKDAAYWWDENGPFKPLHRLNPARLGYIRDQICEHYGCDPSSLTALKGLKILDIGCGGGLVCEPLARMGGDVAGIDADRTAIEIARKHARSSGLQINYEATTAETLLPSSPRRRGSGKEKPAPRLRGDDNILFDVVLALEIIEHVENPAAFIETCARLIKPGGLIIFSTLNRTIKSLAFGIGAAEYILRWVPRGTHDWRKFIRPSELAKMARAAGLEPHDVKGLVYSPFKDDFEISENDVGVNYFMLCRPSK